jgi:tRNA-specific adenosine deaminase 3
VLVGALHTAFTQHPEFPKPRVTTIPVPQFAPLSADIAKRWSAAYWPCTFKNANPYGPNPNEVTRVEGELYHANSVHHWMRLANRVAKEGRNHGLGEAIGAVVVERTEEYGVRVVAVAADARRCGLPHDAGGGTGNVMGHAVMRAISLVAQKRRIIDGKAGSRTSGFLSDHGSPPWSPRPQSPNRRQNQRSSDDTSSVSSDYYTPTESRHGGDWLNPPPHTNDSFLEEPMTFLEAHYFAPSTLQTKGYLCLHLEMYTTHEPCVMCSMALLHSRFGRVVFAREMPETGGLIVERKLPTNETTVDCRYGLFWRQELNWKFLCFQYSGGKEDSSQEEDENDLATQLAHTTLAPQERFEVAELDAKMHA